MKLLVKHIDYILTGSLAIITLCIGSVLLSNHVDADPVSSTASANASVNVASACSMTALNTSAHTISMVNSTTEENVGITTLTATCNDAGGLAIYAVGYSGDEYGNTNMIGTSGNIATGTSDSTSNWSMRLYTATGSITPSSITSTFTAVPSTYTKFAELSSGTTGSSALAVNATYRFHISATQPADTYTGKVKYTMVHPATEVPPSPQPSTAGYINYYANASTAVGTMGRQSAADGDTVTLFASNFSRDGYGFAGWSDAYDYTTNPNANFYGPNEDITVPTGTTANGLSLYAVWVKSAGTMQSSGTSVCNSLTAATYNNEGDADESTWSITANLSSISALTDARDNQTYAIAKLTDGKCWMIENLRLDNTPELTSANTNNPSLPLTNIYDTSSISNYLSPTSSIAYDTSTAPEGWCDSYTAACTDQSRVRTDNTANRVVYTTTQTMSTNANFYSYGNYYNWYSATAGNGTYAKSSGTTGGDICPTGWHLPTGHSTSATVSGEFGLLNNSLGGYKDTNNVAQLTHNSTTPTGVVVSQRLRHFPNNLLYSGNGSGGSIANRGSSGLYWSPSPVSNNNAFGLLLGSGVISPGTYSNIKSNGWAVRCLTPST